MSIDDKLDRVVARHAQISDLLSKTDGSDPQEFVKLSKEYAELNDVVEAIRGLRGVREEIDGLKEILNDEDSDGDMKELAELEMAELREREVDVVAPG
jgi:peptide chain release factor 1